MKWEIQFGKSCGPLRFGMNPGDVREVVGPPDEDRGNIEIRNGHPWEEYRYVDGKLAYLRTYPAHLWNLTLDGADLLSMPILSVIQLLDRANGGTGQAQGGSLYFEIIGAALLQFEIQSIRQFVLFGPGFDHGEPLKSVSLSEVAEYYAEQNGDDPSGDLLGSAK